MAGFDNVPRELIKEVATKCYNTTIDDQYPILYSEVTTAIKELKLRWDAGIDNIPGELIKLVGTIMNKICQKVWEKKKLG